MLCVIMYHYNNNTVRTFTTTHNAPILKVHGCKNYSCMVLFGVVSIMIGLIMTLYGLLKRPFWGADRTSCSFCMEDREAVLINTRNCLIAGPVLIGLGLFFNIIGTILRKLNAKRNPTKKVKYNATGSLSGTSAQGINPAVQVNYPKQPSAVFAQPCYYKNPATHQVTYPNNGVRYPQQGHQVGGYHQQQSGDYPTQPDAVPRNSQQTEKCYYPPPSDFGVAPPSYNEALATPSAPQQ